MSATRPPMHKTPDPPSRRSPWRGRALVAVALAAIACVPLLPVLFAGRFPRTHDGIRYELITRLLTDAFRHGVLYPRWLPDLAGGAGYPTLTFYQPLVSYVAAACSLVPGVTTASAGYAAMYVMLAIGAGGAYRVARSSLARPAALAAAATFLLTPYLYVNLLVRGDFSEAAAMLLAPWPIWSIVAIERRLRAGRGARAASFAGAAALAAILYAHPAVSLFYVPVLLTLAIAQVASSTPGRARRLRLYLAVGCLGVVAASPYWFVVWQCAGFVHLDRAIDARYGVADYAVPLARLLGRDWGFGSALAAPGRAPLRTIVDDLADPMSTPIGLPHALLALAGCAAALRVRRPLPVAAGAIAILLAVAITPLATPFWTHAGALVRFVQFPWRLLAVLAPLTLVLAVTAFARLGRRGWRSALPWVVVACSIAWYAPMFRVSSKPFDFVAGPRTLGWREADAFVDETIANLHALDEPMAGANEFEPIWVTVHDRPRAGLPIVIGRVQVRETAANTSYRIDVELDSPRPDAVIVGQSYFPGWRVSVNGRPIDDADLRANVTAEGKMIVPVPAGRGHVVAFYDGPPFWRLRVAVTLTMIVALVAWIARASRAAALPIESTIDDVA